MIYGVISLMGAQFLALLLGVIIYTRQKSALDIEKHDRGTFGVRVDKALAAASDALLGVQRIDLEQYQALAKKHAQAVEEIELLKARVLSLEESVKSLSNKLASRSRVDKREAEEEAAASARAANMAPFPHPKSVKEGEFEIPAGVDPADYLRSIGVGLPLNGPPSYVQETMPLEQPHRPGFGAVARR